MRDADRQAAGTESEQSAVATDANFVFDQAGNLTNQSLASFVSDPDVQANPGSQTLTFTARPNQPDRAAFDLRTNGTFDFKAPAGRERERFSYEVAVSDGLASDTFVVSLLPTGADFPTGPPPLPAVVTLDALPATAPVARPFTATANVMASPSPEGKVAFRNAGGVLESVTVPPAGLPPAKSIVSLDAGDFHACAVTRDGAVYCWGFNGDGQTGQNPDPDVPGGG